MKLAMKFQEKYEDGFVEGKELGKEEGKQQGKLDTLAALVLDGVFAIETAAQRANMTVEKFSEYLE